MTHDDLERTERARHDHGILLDAQDDDWAWRRKIRAKHATARLYRLAIGVVGLIIVVSGLLLVPLPGPGWIIVFAGLALWGSEFEWAQRLLDWVKTKVREWNDWVRARPLWVQGLAALATFAAILAIFWLLFRISGVPAFLPDAAEGWLRTVVGL